MLGGLTEGVGPAGRRVWQRGALGEGRCWGAVQKKEKHGNKMGKMRERNKRSKTNNMENRKKEN